VETKKCCFQRARPVSKDRERHCLLMALMMRREELIFCKELAPAELE
jgi:hypothetical protein